MERFLSHGGRIKEVPHGVSGNDPAQPQGKRAFPFSQAPRATRTAMNSADVVAMNDALKVEMDDPQEVARQIVHAIATEREELYLGWPEKLFVRLNGLLPRLVDLALRKQLPVVKRFARADQPRPSHPSGDHP